MPLTSGFTHCSGLNNDKPQSGVEAGLPRLTGLGVGWVGLGGVAMVLNGVLLSFQDLWLAPARPTCPFWMQAKAKFHGSMS